MVSFEELPDEAKTKVIAIWKDMSEADKSHFVNQVAITLSVLGSDNGGKKQIVEIVKYLLQDGAENLADFGIYMRIGMKAIDKKTIRAIRIVDSYRMKHDLPNMPSKPLL